MYGELRRLSLQDCNGCFVGQCALWVPWLNDLTEDDLDFRFVLLLCERDHGAVHGLEQLGGELERSLARM